MRTFLGAVILFFFASTFVQAKELTIVNAGLSFSGDYGGNGLNSIEKKFPYSSSLYNLKDAQNPNLSRLNKIFTDKLKSGYKGKYKLEFDNLMRAEDNVLSMSFVLNFENVFESESVDLGVIKTEILVGGDILLFDFKTKKIVASYPVMIAYSLLTKKRLSPAEIAQKYSLIFGDKSFIVEKQNLNIFDNILSKLNNINLASTSGASIGVKNVILGAEAKTNILKCNLGDVEGTKKILSNLFNAKLSSKFNISVLPYTNESRVFINMADSYMESSDLGQIVLEVPDPSYEITLNLEKLLFLKTKEKRNLGIYFFGASAYVGMNVKSMPMKVNNRFKKGLSNVYPLGQEGNWSFNAEYMRALLLLMQTIPAEITTKPENKELLNILNRCK